MSSVLRIEYDPHSQYCALHHSYNKRFVDFLSRGIKPTSYRRYDPGSKLWMVHVEKIPVVVSFGKKYFDYVDYRALPEDLQIQVVQFIQNAKESRSFAEDIVRALPASPHATLFVVPEAPWEVIKASYKALAFKYHPDQGGSPEEFRRVQEAYNKLKVKYKP